MKRILRLAFYSFFVFLFITGVFLFLLFKNDVDKMVGLGLIMISLLIIGFKVSPKKAIELIKFFLITIKNSTIGIFEKRYFIHVMLVVITILLSIFVWINRYSYALGEQGEAWRINNLTGKGCALDTYIDRELSFSSNKLVKDFTNCLKVKE